MTVQVEIGSAEWLQMRKGYIGASDAPIIMGVSPWTTPQTLWMEKLGLGQPKVETFAMLRGKQMESQALDAFTQETGISMSPYIMFHKEYPFMMATLDGYNMELHKAVEIKCPGKKDHAIAMAGTVPCKYYPQLQHQIATCRLDEIYYYSYTLDTTALIIVKRDDDYIEKLIEKEKYFWKCVLEFREIEHN